MNTETIIKEGVSFVLTVGLFVLFQWFYDRRLAKKIQRGESINLAGRTFNLVDTTLGGDGPRIFMNAHQLLTAVRIMVPDTEEDNLETEFIFQRGKGVVDDDGTIGDGLFMWLADYPDEGSIFLDDEPTDIELKEYALQESRATLVRTIEKNGWGEDAALLSVDAVAAVAILAIRARNKALREAASITEMELQFGWTDLFSPTQIDYINKEILVGKAALITGLVTPE